MKKVILLFALLTCLVAFSPEKGVEEISLEDWCIAQGQYWYQSEFVYTCIVVGGVVVSANEVLIINLEQEQGEQILILGEHGANGKLTNNGLSSSLSREVS